MHVVVRTALPLSTLALTIARVVRDVDPAVPVAHLREMDGVFAESIRRPRLLAQLLTLFSALALLLSAVGTYGLLASIVTEQRREIGIRLAFGAARSTVLSGIIKLGLSLTMCGSILGLAGALALNRLVASLLFGVGPTDTTSWGSGFLASTRVLATKVFVIAHLFHPVHGFAFELFCNGDMRHGGGWGRAVPVLLARRAPDNVTRPNLFDRTTPALYKTATSGDDENLTARMRVPCCPSAGLERHTRPERTRWIRRLEQNVNADHAREILRRSFC
jgi:FtsX-like permease family